ncbi:T6SS immunity protein Tli4 family protein [Iodobacter sp. CM08]|uniref:T6SS immunity protein Tli4 family protein n=1 Tax=Iodobacter sp. CM08 TaxID=3085902 RepID=UPI0029816CAF|nr:T6SS immunity protein Tli4 family protein [Iodobacter sp. CM08]MDW5416656.1 T6SS immunity protein Tli4 family protein [Iodobacter sp. CM08]
MFENTKTYCFGRYLVDVPYVAELKGFGNKYLSTAIESGTGRDLFKKIIKEKIDALKNENTKRGFKYVNEEFAGDDEKRILISKADLYGDVAYGIDTFKINPKNKAGGSIYFYTAGQGYDDKRINEIIDKYKKLLNQTRYRTEKEIPKEPGFCFENGFVANDGKTSQPEEANLYFVLKNNPYVKIRIFSHVYFNKEQTLLERIDSSGVMKKFLSKVKYNKQGKRIINGLNGEEALTTFPSDDETGIAHVFTWETLGEIGNPLFPSINLEIKTGDSGGSGTFPSTLSQQEAMALYETIVKSIRIRPTQ